jgi:hypothetical protein
MTDGEQEQKPIVAEVVPAKQREVIIETDGARVNITKNEVTPLELKEICRMLLRQLGG